MLFHRFLCLWIPVWPTIVNTLAFLVPPVKAISLRNNVLTYSVRSDGGRRLPRCLASSYSLLSKFDLRWGDVTLVSLSRMNKVCCVTTGTVPACTWAFVYGNTTLGMGSHGKSWGYWQSSSFEDTPSSQSYPEATSTKNHKNISASILCSYGSGDVITTKTRWLCGKKKLPNTHSCAHTKISWFFAAATTTILAHITTSTCAYLPLS